MPLALGTGAILLVVLLWELARPTFRRALTSARLAFSRRGGRSSATLGYDPGRERRAELRARALLRSCVEEADWAMYRDLGFLRVWGRLSKHEHDREAPYAYLIYPHKPIVAFVPQTGALLNEYCVAFPDHTRPYGSTRLPDSDDVLAKWMALTADERRLIADANMHLPGRQIDPGQVRRDLLRLTRWERTHAGTGERQGGDPREADRVDGDLTGPGLIGPDRAGPDEGIGPERAGADRGSEDRTDTLQA